MTIFCRLCAEFKDSTEIITSINDLERLIREKLIACCQWNVELTESNLPEEVCECCLDKLEKSWLFSESVQLAQRKLLEIFENDADIKPFPADSDPSTNYDYNTCSDNCMPNLMLEKNDCDAELSSVKCELNEDGIDECPEQIFVEAITLPGTATECEEHLINQEIGTKPQKRYECDLCQRGFTTSNKLKMHKLVHSNERPFSCPKCKKRFKSMENVKSHLRRIHGRDKSNDAKKKETTESNLKDFKYACNHCDRCFGKKSNFVSHQISHSSDRPYECWMCHATFKTEKALRGHMKLHTEDPPNECDICHKGFRNYSYFSQHMKDLHGIQVPKRVRRPKAPPKPPDRNFTCELCGISCKQNVHLQIHMMTTHSDLRPHKCDICGLGFKRESILREHLQTHTEFQYKCNQCEKTFRKKLSLRKHLEYHTGSIVKPFVCDCCGKAFRLNVNLVEHRRIHTGEKPYSCEHCASSFRTMSSYYGHLKKEHGISALARKRAEQLRATAMS